EPAPYRSVQPIIWIRTFSTGCLPSWISGCRKRNWIPSPPWLGHSEYSTHMWRRFSTHLRAFLADTAVYILSSAPVTGIQMKFQKPLLLLDVLKEKIQLPVCPQVFIQLTEAIA